MVDKDHKINPMSGTERVKTIATIPLVLLIAGKTQYQYVQFELCDGLRRYYDGIVSNTNYNVSAAASFVMPLQPPLCKLI